MQRASRLVTKLRGMNYGEKYWKYWLALSHWREEHGNMIITHTILMGIDKVDKKKLY